MTATNTQATHPLIGGVFVCTTKHNEGDVVQSKSSIDSLHSFNSESSSVGWISAGSKDHNRNAPLIVDDPDLVAYSSSSTSTTSSSNQSLESRSLKTNSAEALGRIILRSRKLPSTGQFASDHILVNQERTKRTIAPLVRLHELDDIARDHAEAMANADQLFHMELSDLQTRFSRPTTRRFGANVATGSSIRDIHYEMMSILSDKNNMLDRRYTHMGMAVARGHNNNKLFLCQIFRG